jgi:hypothetical protein
MRAADLFEQGLIPAEIARPQGRRDASDRLRMAQAASSRLTIPNTVASPSPVP